MASNQSFDCVNRSRGTRPVLCGEGVEVSLGKVRALFVKVARKLI